ncbi:MAG: hypothetical protein ACE14T_06125 [Syntrophales bacterium]
MASKEQFEKEIQIVAARKGFKLVDPHTILPAGKPEKKEEARAEASSCPLRFEGKALRGKKIIIYVPQKYCDNGSISLHAGERLAREGFCGFAERSKEIYDCELLFRPNTKNQWRIEVTD